MQVLVIKTGALGDVLRTTSILPGLHGRHPGCRVIWVTAHAALDLVQHHPLVDETIGVDPRGADELAVLGAQLAARSFDRVLSFDDEEGLCALATAAASTPERISGAWLDEHGERRYTADVAPWFDMGLLSVHGKAEADRRKLANRESHPAIFARMLGVEMGRPQLPLDDAHVRAAAAFAEREGLHARGLAIGLNSGAGGRWESKKLPIDRSAELLVELSERLHGDVTFLLLGGPDEGERNVAIRAAVGSQAHVVDAGPDNGLLAFAALIDRLDLLITSDSLALHLGVARDVPVLAFFAPTSAAEIELYGRGEKVRSTAPDYGSYRSETDTSTLTTERLADAALRILAAAAERSSS